MSDAFLWENLFEEKGSRSTLEMLERVPIFSDLNRKDLKAIERILHRRQYAAGEPIFRNGEMGLGMYIIVSGEVVITAGGTESELARLHDGEFFGEMSLLTEEPRNADARAVVDTQVFGFFQPDLLTLLETRPRLGVAVVMKLARIVAERLRHAVMENRRLFDELARYKS